MTPTDATLDEVDQAVVRADGCFTIFRKSSGFTRSTFLLQIKEELQKDQAEIIDSADQETALGKERLSMEFQRALGEIENFSKICAKESWLQPIPGTKTIGKKREIKMLPLGPVAVIGACNFPLAISVVGTDTISALMVGCPVVVKSHPGHPKTCEKLADAVRRAIKITKMPNDCFQLFHGEKNEVTQCLVRHPLISAIAFTGSLAGGSALHGINQERTHPVPFYAEMGSLNPLFALPCLLHSNCKKFAQGFVQAVNLYAGQMCTKPGALFILKSSLTNDFTDALQAATENQIALPMLNAEVHANYEYTCLQLEKEIQLLCSSGNQPSGNNGEIKIFTMDGKRFLKSKHLRAEAFGPSSLLVVAEDENQLLRIAKSLDGSLTASLHSTEEDHLLRQKILPVLESKVGRLLHNGFPPGVVPGKATHHGGPWPSTTDSRFTSIGDHGYQRFLRPLLRQS
jgi:2,5-dioxopentanoate dehydrogenase